MSTRSFRYSSMSLHTPKSIVTSTDRDAWAFLEAATIYNANQQKAIIQLVRGLKRTDLWSKMKAIYPFVGGTTTTHKWNLKDPRNSDAAFRLTFSGGWTHSISGSLPNGTTGYADTNFNLSTQLQLNSVCIGMYSRTNNNTGNRDIMAGQQPTNESYSSLELSLAGKHYHRINSPEGALNPTVVNTQGHFVMNRSAFDATQLYKNGSSINTSTVTSSFAPNVNLALAANQLFNNVTNTTSISGYSNREFAFAHFGESLNSTEISNLYTIVQKYQTTLGRQV